MAPTAAEKELYLTPVSTPICVLDAKEAFDGLTAEEKRYAHHLSQGCWAGSLACLAQCSPESPKMFLLFFKLFTADSPEKLKEESAKAGVAAEEFEAFMQFVAVFFGNMGNYLSFGDTKFVPRCEASSVAAIVAASSDKSLAADWEAIAAAVYDLSAGVKQMGLEGKGISTYYSPGITEAEIKIVQDFLQSQNLGDQAYNTRLFKDGDVYKLAIASAETKAPVTHDFNGSKIEVVYGDHAPFMKVLADSIAEAIKNAPADRADQVAMLQQYVTAFKGGDINAHKDSQRAWVKDKGPPVETNIGFIESYRDPFGVRGEFEGFVSVVNREQSRKFQTLVDRAAQFIELLPWPKEFEKDAFLRPDFTSLDVVTFASSGIPAGINIPNYDDIRQDVGFKNVSLGNVLAAASPSERITFLTPPDQAIFTEWRGRAFEVQVAIHELLGHGSGKLLRQEPDGSFNFDADKVMSPYTGAKVATFYLPGETWDAKFGQESSSYEECRAECVGIYLCPVPEILSIFGHSYPDEVPDVVYCNWLLMARAGLLGLEFYTPETKSWRQAHMQGRFAILRVMLEAGEGLCEIRGAGDDVHVALDRSKIMTVGRKAVGDFLGKLNVYKATADAEAGLEMYRRYTAVPDDMLLLRQAVLSHKQPRKIFVQAVSRLGAGGEVSLEFPEASPAGMVRSFTDRFAAAGPLGALPPLLASCGPFPPAW